MIETGIRTLLVGETTVSAIVGSRVHVGYVEHGIDLPYATIEPITTDFLNTLDGTSNQELTQKELDVNCYSGTLIEAKQLADAIRIFLDDYTGSAGAQDTINAVILRDEVYAYLAPTDGSGTGRHFINLDFLIQYTPN